MYVYVEKQLVNLIDGTSDENYFPAQLEFIPLVNFCESFVCACLFYNICTAFELERCYICIIYYSLYIRFVWKVFIIFLFMGLTDTYFIDLYSIFFLRIRHIHIWCLFLPIQKNAKIEKNIEIMCLEGVSPNMWIGCKYNIV